MSGALRPSFFRLLVAIVMTVSLAGCASFGRKLKAFLGGKPAPAQTASARPAGVSFNQQPNYAKGIRRQYKRVTKQKMENEAQLEDRSGSLWVMEGQGAYLFSQNIMRLIGDPIGVKIEGEPRQQLEAKVSTIKSLLQKLEQRRLASRAPAATRASDKGKGQKEKKPTNQNAAAKAGQKPGSSDFSVKTVPTRIVERMVDGNYRVKGSQAFMIGSREYKVIVTGVVRAEDFRDEGISAKQLLDPKYDIVSARRKGMQL